LNLDKYPLIASKNNQKTPLRCSTLASTISSSRPSNPIKNVDSFEEPSIQSHTNTLDTMVTQFLRDQHAHCPNPISVLPAFSLLNPHRCPEPIYFQRASTNLTKRLMKREMNSIGTSLGTEMYDRKYFFSRFRYLRAFRDDDCVITCSSFLGQDQENLIAGTQEGDVKIFDVEGARLLRSGTDHDHSIWSIKVSKNQQLFTISSPDGPSSLWKVDDLMNSKAFFEEDSMLLFNNCNDRLIGTSNSIAKIYSPETAQVLLFIYLFFIILTFQFRF